MFELAGGACAHGVGAEAGTHTFHVLQVVFLIFEFGVLGTSHECEPRQAVTHFMQGQNVVVLLCHFACNARIKDCGPRQASTHSTCLKQVDVRIFCFDVRCTSHGGWGRGLHPHVSCFGKDDGTSILPINVQGPFYGVWAEAGSTHSRLLIGSMYRVSSARCAPRQAHTFTDI